MWKFVCTSLEASDFLFLIWLKNKENQGHKAIAEWLLYFN